MIEHLIILAIFFVAGYVTFGFIAVVLAENPLLPQIKGNENKIAVTCGVIAIVLKLLLFGL